MSFPAGMNRGWVPAPGAILLDKFRLDAQIGEGGMGTVWRATNTTLDRQVAVKFVRGGGERSGERFLREAKIAASVRSPYVVDVLEFGLSPAGDPVLIMELLEGEALDERLDHGWLSPLEAVRVMAQILVGLDAVHRAGIIHRDLKPANIFLSNEGTADTFARLIDFGVSHATDPSSALRRGKHGTDERTIVGTPAYIAPEQAEGRKDVDARADVYSIGVMLYELLGRELPFDDEHPGKTLYKVMDGAHKPLGELCPDLPELSAVVERAISLDRELRPQSARELREQLLEAAGLSGDAAAGAMRSAAASGRQNAIQTLPPPALDTLPPPADVTAPAPVSAASAPSRAPLLIGVITLIVVIAVGVGLWLSREPHVAARPPDAAPPAASSPPASSAAAQPAPSLTPTTVSPTTRDTAENTAEATAEDPASARRPRRTIGRRRDPGETPATTETTAPPSGEPATPPPTQAPAGTVHRELDF